MTSMETLGKNETSLYGGQKGILVRAYLMRFRIGAYHVKENPYSV